MWPFRNHGYGKPCEIKGTIPFSGRYSSHISNGNNRNRLRQFQYFMGWDTVPPGLDVLDIGGANFISRGLGITHNTGGDLNKVMRTPLEQYDVVTCFEVINHLFQHGTLLTNIYCKLKPGGTLYLSTPYANYRPWWCPFPIGWIHGEGNYVEIRPRALRLLLEYHGFKIIRHEHRNPWPTGFIFYGIRPPLRWLLNRYQLIEAIKQ